MPVCNTTIEDARVNEKIYPGLTITFHELGLIISAVFAGFATILSLYLIMQHALHYSRPWEQKHIIRILFLVPVYAVVSFLSYWNYQHTIYYQVLRDSYEAFAVASFFTLLCNYTAPDLHLQKEYFRQQRPKNWLLPLNWAQRMSKGRLGPERGLLKVPQSGLTWFNIVWIAVFQYCFIQVFFTFVAVVAEATDRYCLSSESPAFAHVWITVFEGVSVTVAMYALIQFYYQIKADIQEHRPILKLASIKLVIFLTFWQNWVVSLATPHFHATEYLSLPDVSVGVPSMLLCIEMAIFAIIHLFAFPWKRPYSLRSINAITGPAAGYSSGQARYKGGPLGIYALADASNPWDIIKASARGVRWLFIGRRYRHHDVSYQLKPGGGDSSTDRLPVSGGLPYSNDSYSSSKLGPVGPGGPAAMKRERHVSVESRMSRERPGDLRYSESGSDSLTGDLGDGKVGGTSVAARSFHRPESPDDLELEGLRDEREKAYFSAPPHYLSHSPYDAQSDASSTRPALHIDPMQGGNTTYYGHELPPAPIPQPYEHRSPEADRRPGTSGTSDGSETTSVPGEDPFRDRRSAERERAGGPRPNEQGRTDRAALLMRGPGGDGR